MRVFIDNFDGSGAIDYTPGIQFGMEATILRSLNEPTLCRLPFLIGSSLRLPEPGAHVQIASLDGQILFTGFVIEAPAVAIIGEQAAGAVRSALILAASEEAVLDGSVNTAGRTLLAQSAQQNWSALGLLPRQAGITISLAEQLGSASRLELNQGSRWSESASELAASTRSAYQSVASRIHVSPLGTTVHTIREDDAGLQFDSVSPNDLRWLASDITVIGREEPRAYITEIFQGDGVTASFLLSEKPFVPSAQQKTSIVDLFQGTHLNPQLWSLVDPGGHIALAAGGLTCTGGSGKSNESTVSSVQQLEMGGSIVLEAGGGQFSPGCSGVVCGLFAGTVSVESCFAGFILTSSADRILVSSLVNGMESGSTFQVIPGRLYTLRVRVVVPEVERVRQSYFYEGAKGSASSGGEIVQSAGWLHFEIQDVTSGTPSVSEVLFSGAIAVVPAACIVGPLCSGSLSYSLKSLTCTQSGPLWVGSSETGGIKPTPLIVGSSQQGGACHLTSSDTLTFYPESVPTPGSLIYASYRNRGRSVARRILPVNSGQGAPISALTWIGTVTRPTAWSSMDCGYAADALLGVVSSGIAPVKGIYSVIASSSAYNPWPGDSLVSENLEGNVSPCGIVRSVQLKLLGGAPPLVSYEAAFASEPNSTVSMQLSHSIPQDVTLPQQATAYTANVPSLSELGVTAITGTTLEVSIGAAIPVNGGVEVRRRDDTFGPGSDSDLVLRSSTESITVPRVSAREAYFFRIYDGSTPPNYSAFSAAVLINVTF